MTALRGTITGGQVVLDRPANLPDGTPVEVLPVDQAHGPLGMREEDWPDTPESIATLLKRMDELEPGWLSPEEDAAWRAALREERETEKARFFEDGEKLRRMWE